MKTPEIERILADHGVNPTAVRILVYRTIDSMPNAFAMADVENALPSLDRSTAFRTLTLFANRHLLHEIEDGSGSKKYCVCHNSHPCSLNEMHCHFRCEHCGTTYCLPHTIIPPVSLPAGFEPRKTEVIFRGICAKCNR